MCLFKSVPNVNNNKIVEQWVHKYLDVSPNDVSWFSVQFVLCLRIFLTSCILDGRLYVAGWRYTAGDIQRTASVA